MSLQKFMANNANYHSWATERFVEWLSTKSDALLYKEVPSSFNTIISTVNHIWGTDEYWYSIIAEIEGFDGREQSTELDIQEVLSGVVKRAKEISKLINSYDEADLSKKVKIVSPYFECELPKYEYLQHLINHSTYHRGQIVTMGRNIGITDAPMTDYNYFNVIKEQ